MAGVRQRVHPTQVDLGLGNLGAGIGGLLAAEHVAGAEHEAGGADDDVGAVAEGDLVVGDAVDPDAVGGAQVLHRPLFARAQEERVDRRDFGVIQDEIARLTADHEAVFLEGDSLAAAAATEDDQLVSSQHRRDPPVRGPTPLFLSKRGAK